MIANAFFQMGTKWRHQNRQIRAKRCMCWVRKKNDFALTIMEESIESKGKMEVVVEEREEGGTEGRIYNEDSLPGDLQKTVLSRLLSVYECVYFGVLKA